MDPAAGCIAHEAVTACIAVKVSNTHCHCSSFSSAWSGLVMHLALCCISFCLCTLNSSLSHASREHPNLNRSCTADPKLYWLVIPADGLIATCRRCWALVCPQSTSVLLRSRRRLHKMMQTQTSQPSITSTRSSTWTRDQSSKPGSRWVQSAAWPAVGTSVLHTPCCNNMSTPCEG